MYGTWNKIIIAKIVFLRKVGRGEWKANSVKRKGKVKNNSVKRKADSEERRVNNNSVRQIA